MELGNVNNGTKEHMILLVIWIIYMDSGIFIIGLISNTGDVGPWREVCSLWEFSLLL